jgi:hypothetical protein
VTKRDVKILFARSDSGKTVAGTKNVEETAVTKEQFEGRKERAERS